jgi:pyruvate kinase
MMISIYGTLGPACDNENTLSEMFAAGMTGMRINLSHLMLEDALPGISKLRAAAEREGIIPEILIDMQGPELRIGRFDGSIALAAGDKAVLGEKGIPLAHCILSAISAGLEILLDDGKILAEVTAKDERNAYLSIKRGGILTQRKSIAVPGLDIHMPAITEDDEKNIALAKDFGVTGVMQPFVRSKEDLLQVRKNLERHGCSKLKIYAKIENKRGVENLRSFMDACDEIVIARGDLGNTMPLWELPRVQKQIAGICNENRKPFMVVTQMLSSMEVNEVPTRAEVSDIYNAVLDGASSVMVTGETAVGKHPVEVIKYLHNTAYEAAKRDI